MNHLYCDGGVIGSNPSTIGGTWAWILVDGKGRVLCRDSGIAPAANEYWISPVTNNQTELYALIRGLGFLSVHYKKKVTHIYSDSNVSLGRVFRKSSMNNIPVWMQRSLHYYQGDLINFYKFPYTLLAGHPTKSQLLSGVGKNGHPVSKWNVWCDKECQRLAKDYQDDLK